MKEGNKDGKRGGKEDDKKKGGRKMDEKKEKEKNDNFFKKRIFNFLAQGACKQLIK